MKAKETLETAASLVSGDRRETHGNPKSSFSRTATMWSAYLDCDISAKDVALMMALLKVTRTMAGNHNDDDYVDGAGYMALAAEVSDD
jgi:hypothetical protein